MSVNKPEIETVIIYDRQAQKCEAGCAPDWSLLENMAMADQQVRVRFGDRVHLRYLDLSQPAAEDFALKWQRKVREQGLPLPLLVIDDVPRISGEFDMRMLLNAIATEIEIRA